MYARAQLNSHQESDQVNFYDDLTYAYTNKIMAGSLANSMVVAFLCPLLWPGGSGLKSAGVKLYFDDIKHLSTH